MLRDRGLTRRGWCLRSVADGWAMIRMRVESGPAVKWDDQEIPGTPHMRYEREENSHVGWPRHNPGM